MARGNGRADDEPDQSVAAVTVGRRRAGAHHVAGRGRPRSAAPTPTPTPTAVASRSTRRPERGRTDRYGDSTPPSGSRAGRNLPAAIGVGMGLGLLILASVFVYRPSFVMIAGVAVVYGSYELSRAMAHSGVRPSLTPVVVGGVALLAAAWTRGPNGLVVALLVTVCGIFVWRLADGAQNYLRDVTASVLILLYLPALAGFAVLLVHPHDGAGRVVAFVATVVCSDTGGYVTGVLFGRHPLAPIVSKAKTWEGFVGSLLFCSVAGVLFMTRTFHEVWWKGLLFGLAIVVTATLGDLGESMIKRDLGIKDMGHLLPGHGGLMDRLDSLLPCAAVAYLVLSAFVPAG
jgi:phosphatidate cytidylyltransferase